MPADSQPTSKAMETPPLGEISEYPMVIRESHLDSFGHINNAVYLEIFEEARWEIITAKGYGLAKVMETKQGPTILEINLRFLREIRNREPVVIKTWVSKMNGKVGTLRQVIVNSRGEECCIADFVMGLFDLRQRKLIEPTEDWKRALGIP